MSLKKTFLKTNKKMKKIQMIVAFLSIGSATIAQKTLELTVRYNTDVDKYEVYARPNFTERNFHLGPSQITLVVPSAVSDEKLRIFNSDGGSWEDNSIVYAPAANAQSDYHGISTLGAKTDLSEGQESLLFYFSLPKGINAADVRLFENGKDPNSSAPGMKGGDFSNSLNDALSDEVYLKNYKKVSSKATDNKLNKSDLLESEGNRLTLYPNTTSEQFRVSLLGIEESEEVVLMVSTEMGREIMHIKGTKRDLEARNLKIPAEISSQNLVVRVKTQKSTFGRKLVLDRE